MSEMARIAVICDTGFEESETITIVDLLRRGGHDCELLSMEKAETVHSMQGIDVAVDGTFEAPLTGFDGIVVPGGRTLAARLIARADLTETLASFSEQGKLVCGMCSGTTVLEAAGVLAGRRATGYTGYAEKLKSAHFVADEVAVADGNVVTSQGPATPYPFALKILKVLGTDTQELRSRMLYTRAGGR